MLNQDVENECKNKIKLSRLLDLANSDGDGSRLCTK